MVDSLKVPAGVPVPLYSGECTLLDCNKRVWKKGLLDAVPLPHSGGSLDSAAAVNTAVRARSDWGCRESNIGSWSVLGMTGTSPVTVVCSWRWPAVVAADSLAAVLIG